MSKKDTQIIKGIAIILIFFHHLFTNEDLYGEFTLTGLILSENTTILIADSCKVCVSLFVFITAYAISIKFRDLKFNRETYIKNSVDRYKKLMTNYIYIFAILLLLSYMFDLGYGATDAWGESQLSRAIGIICNATGLVSPLKSTWFCSSWWYMSLAILLIFLIPLLQLAVKKLGAVPSIIISLFLVRTLELSTTNDVLTRYLLIAVMGIIFAEYSIPEQINEYFKANKIKRVLMIALIIACIPFILYVRQYIEANFIIEVILALIIIAIVILFIKYIPILNNLLAIIGKYSMGMWLIHVFISKYWFRNITYSFKNIWLILLFLLLISFLASFILAKVKKCYTKFITSQIYDKNYRIVLISLLMTILCFVIAAATSAMTYLTNDDAGIQNALSGVTTGEPYITHQFINIILGFLISSLYKLFPNFQWWYIYSQLLIGIGILLIHFSIFKICGRKKISPNVPIIILTCVDFSYFVYAISKVSFTIVPAILGTGLVSLIFASGNIKSRKKFILLMILVFMGYILVLIHRPSSAYALLCFILLALLWLTTKNGVNKKVIAKYLTLVCSFLLITIAITAFNSYSTKKLNGSYFVEYNNARSQYMDYSHDGYYENQEIYEETGWSYELYILVNNWFFMDENVTTEAFTYLTENSNSDNDIIATSKELIKSVYESESCRGIICLWMCSVFIAIIALILNYNNRNFLFACMNNVGCIILLLYQLLQGRIIYRSIYVVLLPTLIINCILSVNNYSEDKRESLLMKILMTVSIAFCTEFALIYTFDTGNNEYRENLIKKGTEIEEYAIDNSNNIYICSPLVYNNINPWNIYTDVKPVNIISWGGSSYNSNIYNLKLEANGIELLSGETVKQNNAYVFFTTNMLSDSYEMKESEKTYCFFIYLQDEFDALGFVIEDNVDNNVFVYKYVFEENVDDFKEYYTVENDEIVKIINESD